MNDIGCGGTGSNHHLCIYFLSFKEKGKTILYSTHSLSTIPELCDRVILLDHGNLILIGNPADVIKEYKEIVKKKEK